MRIEDAERIVEAFVAPLARIEPVTLRPPARRRRRIAWIPLVLAGATVIIAAVVAVAVRRPEQPSPIERSVETTPLTGTTTPTGRLETTISAYRGISQRDRTTGKEKSVVPAASISAAAVAPDGLRVAYQAFRLRDVGDTRARTGCVIAVLDLASGTSRDLSPDCTDPSTNGVNRPQTVVADGDVYRLVSTGGPSWSPDGTSVVFSCGPRGAICVAKADGTAVANIPEGPATNPVFSPDGSQIAFLRWGTPPHVELKPLHVWVMRADGTGARQVAELKQACCEAPQWFGWDAGGRHVLAAIGGSEVVDVASGTTTLLTNGPPQLTDMTRPMIVESS